MNGRSRREYLEASCECYRQAELAEKQMILNEFCRNTGYHRKHAIRLLNGPPPDPKPERPRAQHRAELQRRSDQHPGCRLGGGQLPLCGAAEGPVAPLDAVGPKTPSAQAGDRASGLGHQRAPDRPTPGQSPNRSQAAAHLCVGPHPFETAAFRPLAD
jgi:hypothetical protein